MDNRLKGFLNDIGERYKDLILSGASDYIEVNLGELSKDMGYDDLYEKLKDSYAIIPIKEPQPGMKVRIDGRTFVDYCLHPSGFAVPGYIVKDAGIPCPKYNANDSMILNCT